MEIWKDVIGYEGIYEVSNLGRIRTHINKHTQSVKHGDRIWKQRVLKQKILRKDKTLRVSLYKEKICKDYLVCRLVASSFLENNLNTKLTVNHKDGNRLNNNVENLEWLTLGDNIRHGFENGLYKQDKVIIKNKKGELFEFRSKSMCAKFLEKSSFHLSKKKTVKNKNKEVFDVISIKKSTLL